MSEIGELHEKINGYHLEQMSAINGVKTDVEVLKKMDRPASVCRKSFMTKFNFFSGLGIIIIIFGGVFFWINKIDNDVCIEVKTHDTRIKKLESFHNNDPLGGLK